LAFGEITYLKYCVWRR